MKLIKSPATWIVISELIIIIVLTILGFKITYAPAMGFNWEAIAASGQLISAIAGLSIPFIAILFQNKLDKNKKDISESNLALLQEFEEYKKNLESYTFEENTNEVLKSKALKFINIAMSTKTEAVATHLKIEKRQAFDILVELLRHDGTISAGGQISENNIDTIIWLKKSNS